MNSSCSCPYEEATNLSEPSQGEFGWIRGTVNLILAVVMAEAAGELICVVVNILRLYRLLHAVPSIRSVLLRSSPLSAPAALRTSQLLPVHAPLGDLVTVQVDAAVGDPQAAGPTGVGGVGGSAVGRELLLFLRPVSLLRLALLVALLPPALLCHFQVQRGVVEIRR